MDHVTFLIYFDFASLCFLFPGIAIKKPVTVLNFSYICFCCCDFFLLQLMEEQRLLEFAEALRVKLKYFDELENVRFKQTFLPCVYPNAHF